MATTSKQLHSQSINKSIDQGEDWLIKNSKNYDSVKDLKKGFTRVFGQDNPLLRKSLRSSYGMPKLNPLFFEEKTKTYQSHGKPAFIYGEPEMKNLFEASLYNFNPTVRDKVLNELNDILPKEKITENKKYDLRKKFQDSGVLSEFGINKGLKGPVTRLLIKDLGDNIVNDINFIRYPRTEVGHYINYLKDKVDPKYKKQFNLVNDALNDIKKNNYNGAKNKLNIVENINFDHKVPKYLIDAGYADELEYIKLNPVGENFNQLVKRDSFDKPMARLSRKYENTNVPEEKAKIIEDMNNLKDNFNKRHNDYLSDINIKEVDGKLNISSAAKPMTSSDELIQTLEKNAKENPQFFKLEEANKLSRLSSFPAQAAESKLLSTLASKAGTVGSEFSNFAGGKGMAVLGAGLNYPEMREKGFGKAESLGLGAVKGLTQDTFNFIMDTLPMPSKYSARGAINDVAKEMEAKGESPYVEGIGGLKVLDVTKFDWNSFAEKHPGFFQFFNKAADYVSEKLPTKYKAENIIEHEIKKDPNAPFKSQYYDLYDPRSDKEKLSKEEEDAYKERVRKELFKQNPDIEKEYNKQSTNPVSTGPFYLGTENAQELKVGGRVGYAEGSNDELEIPTLSNQETPMSGIYNSKRLGPEDAISRYQPYSELELLGNISAKKPNYQIEEEYMQNEMPIYEPRDTIPKGSRPVMPNVYDRGPNDGIISLATGGRASFQTGGSANFLKMLRNISDSVRELKNSTHMLGYTTKSEGIAKAAEEALAPYAGGFKGNKHETLLQKIQNAKEHLPKEYHGVLDEMKSYADKHAYDAVDDMAKALDKTIDPNLKFENLSKKMFPMEDPLNDAFIIIDPEKGHSVGRYVQRHTVDQNTGRGIIQTVDTWDPVNRRFLTEEEQKLIGVQSIEKGKEGLN
jgi:hypothetical protein